jgi:DNA adenine methylase
MRSPLRYPGGKTRAVKHILPHIPDCGELCAPFLGGGSLELAIAARGTKVYGYDDFEPLIWFWKALLESPEELADEADELRVEGCGPDNERGLPKEDFKNLREELRGQTTFSLENAANFYAINRSSFSGATFSGGWSKKASYARFTDSSIERIRDFKEPNLVVEHADFKDSILTHPNAFLYLDPPYMLSEREREKLYGDKGNKHKDFDHEGLFELLKERSKWVLSYSGDIAIIEEMYEGFDIIDMSGKWSYGMKNVQSRKIKEKKKMDKSSEILIIGDKK